MPLEGEVVYEFQTVLFAFVHCLNNAVHELIETKKEKNGKKKRCEIYKLANETGFILLKTLKQTFGETEKEAVRVRVESRSFSGVFS